MVESVTSIDKLAAMTPLERMIYGVDEDPEMLSRIEVWKALNQLPFCLIEESEPFSTLDNLGFDFFGNIGKPFSNYPGFNPISVQVKSSESGVRRFITKGINHQLFPLWKAKRLLLLNGRMSPDDLAADLVTQLLHHLESPPSLLLQQVILEQLPPYLRTAYVCAHSADTNSCRQLWLNLLHHK